jgi:hypothetical protein
MCSSCIHSIKHLFFIYYFLLSHSCLALNKLGGPVTCPQTHEIANLIVSSGHELANTCNLKTAKPETVDVTNRRHKHRSKHDEDSAQPTIAPPNFPTLPFKLMYQWHGKKYIGAAHGLLGILYMLMNEESVTTNLQCMTDIKLVGIF